MNSAIKYRLYPTSEQAILINKTFGCCRKVYNLMLADRKSSYKATGKAVQPTPAQYKEEYPFLKEVDSLALANEQLHLKAAYTNFFKKIAGYPTFKSAKHSRKSYTTNNQNGTVSINDGYIRLPKVGFVKLKLHKTAPSDWVIKSATVSQDSDGKFYVSVLYKFDKDITPVSVSDNAIGLDYKSDGLYTDSNGNVCGSPKYYRKSQKRLARLQRAFSRKQKGSNNHEKARIQVAKLHKHTSNQRNDFLHKKSTEIANQYDVVCVETIDLKDIAKSRKKLGKATYDNGYGMFLNMLEYKLADRGKHFVKVNKWFPSSQLCHNCNAIHPEMKNLSLRTFTCSCGYSADRDLNAALNIMQEGLRLIGWEPPKSTPADIV